MYGVFILSFIASRELGVHVDGFIAVTGHTIVVGTSKVSIKSKVTSAFCYVLN